jgi:hypothetical protein
VKKLLIFLFTLTVCVVSGNSQIINKIPLSPRYTSYRIDANLDPVSKTVIGTMEAFWVNHSADVVPDIRLHLYMNAFKNKKSTFYLEYGDYKSDKDHTDGWIEIRSFTDRKGNDLISGMKFISPDDNNIDDQTVAQVILPKPALPGDTVFVNIKFETRLPTIVKRTGYSDDYFFVAQWFPKFGVYEPAGMRYALKGAWNCHQFHSLSEFYSDHSLYTVKITVPKEYVVGTCGIETAADTSGKNKTLAYRAEDIVDFAWTAWPGYVKYFEKWKDVNITLLIPQERTAQVKRQFTAIKNALEYFDRYVGPYPWTYLTIVDPPFKGAHSGGMEYTTMFTSLSLYKMPGYIHLPESATIHEFGHAYFMGILASNEFEEPWLDEGLNSFWEERILDHYYGENSGMIDNRFIKISDKQISRSGYIHSADRQDVSNNEYSWNYPHNTYGMMSYYKTATWLYTLMGIAGEETTNEIFKEYYKKWAFKHPSGKDFVNIVNEVVTRINGDKYGPDINWFFDQTLYGTGICDYKVSGIINYTVETVTDTISKSDKNASEVKVHLYRSKAELERVGEIMLPVDVLIHFNDGKEVLESWDGKSRFKDFVYTGYHKIEWVKIDPGYKIRMDINYDNNSMTLNPDHVQVRKLTGKLISFMQFITSLLSL